MRAINVLLCFVVSFVLAAIVLEIGLRALGQGPQPTINQFDSVTGWSKRPNKHGGRKSSEFDVHYDINALGLRDDPMSSPAKPAGKLRVMMLGDSFVLGYTVERKDLFVDILEAWWNAEGREVDVINAGTEGFSTDQEVAWFVAHAAEYQPDIVVLFPYENDLYWNSQLFYRRFPKPRYTAFGQPEKIVLQDPGPRPGYERFALGMMWSALHEPHVRWSPNVRKLEMEYGAYFKDPPEFMKDAIGRTRGALVALRAQCQEVGAKLFVAPIPGKAAIQSDAWNALYDTIEPAQLADRLRFWKTRERPALDAWSPDQPVETFLSLCNSLSIETLDARASLVARAKSGEKLYFAADWHFNPAGNRAFAGYLHDALDEKHAFPAEHAPRATAPMPAPIEARNGVPTSIFVFAGLWLALATIYALTYRDEPRWKAALGVAVLLGLVFTIAIGGGKLLQLLPAPLARVAFLLAILVLFTFIAWKLGRRIGTIAELLFAFTRRGHWYLMPLVIVLLTIGSLLVVAASSPLIAPFIYTLF